MTEDYSYFTGKPLGVDGQENVQRVRDRAAMNEWLALPIRYENANEPRWNAGAAAANTSAIMRRVEHTRTLGGVVSYASKEGA